MISTVLKNEDLVILESTVPPGTCQKIIKNRLDEEFGGKYFLAHSPERAMPGRTLYEIINNDRIIGGYTPKACEKAKSIYENFIKGEISLTTTRTAEVVKLIENTYRDVNIALANEFAIIAENSDVNVWDAITLANKHPRVEIHKPGPGVGGHCISIDPWFLSSTTQGSWMINLAREINDSMPNFDLNYIRDMVKGIKNPNITILGVCL